MPLQRWTRVIAAAGFSLAVLGSFEPAQAAEANPNVDPRAARILKAALQHVAAAGSFSFTAEVVKEVPIDSGQRIQDISTLRTFVRRPDRLAALREGGMTGEGNMYYDGKTFWLYNRDANVYGSWEAPATIDTLFEKMQEKIGFVPPLASLIRGDAGSGAREKEVRAAAYLGRTVIRGVDCHHLAISGAGGDLEIWIAEGIPVIRRFVVTYTKRPGAPQFTANFLEWDFQAALTDYLFAFEPPPGAKRIEFKVIEQP